MLNAVVNGSQGLGFGLVTGLVIVAMVRLTRNQQQTKRDTLSDADSTADAASQRLADKTRATLAADKPSSKKQKTASL